MTTPVGEPHYFIRRSWRDLVEGELPDRTVLDRAAREHPVIIQAWAPVTPNVVALNSAGLELLGIGMDSPDRIENVRVEKRNGEPTGRLHGSVNNYYSGDPYWESLLRKLPLVQPAAIGPGTERAMRAYNALGVTTVYEGHSMDFPLIEAYRWLRSEERLSVRVLAAPEAELYGQAVSQPLSDEQFEARLHQALDAVERTDDMLRIDESPWAGVDLAGRASCSCANPTRDHTASRRGDTPSSRASVQGKRSSSAPVAACG
jgi:predicted amidohydrolase YtcJ